MFAIFNDLTQDSGNISFGIQTPDGKLFAKTAGRNEPSPGGTPFVQRITALRRAAEVHHGVDHPALVHLVDVVDATDGIVVVYEWFDGDLLRSPAERRDDPGEPGMRFRHLPAGEIVAALDKIIDLHVHLDAAGWVSGDVYDGCVMYDFVTQAVRFMDFECYRSGTYVNNDVPRRRHRRHRDPTPINQHPLPPPPFPLPLPLPRGSEFLQSFSL